MKSNLCTLAFYMVCACWSQTAIAGRIIVDDFTTASSGTGFVQGAGILGGERDVVANGQATFSANAGQAQLALSAGTAANFVLLDYDGIDQNVAVSFLLGDLDLTDGGSNAGVFIQVAAITGTVVATFRVAESLQEYSETSVAISDVGMVFVPFSAFSNSLGVAADLLASAKRFFVRFNFDVGEAITVDAIYLDSSEVFRDRFEETL